MTISRMLNAHSLALVKYDPSNSVVLEWMTSIVPGGRAGFALQSLHGVYLSFVQSGSTPSSSNSYLLPTLDAQIDFSRVLKWIVHCTMNHSTCFGHFAELGADFDNIFPGLELLRLIDVVDDCLVERQEAARYIALSYVWGAVHNFRLTTANRPVLMQAGAISKISSLLPATIQDAITLAKMLNMRYLWVDSLCLLQNDAEDVRKGVEVMDQIYEQAWLTIVAAHGHDANAGLPGVQAGTRFGRVLDRFEVGSGTFIGHLAGPDLLLRRTVYDTRAWTFQEELLSRRLLYFFQDQIIFSCRESRCLEVCRDNPDPTGGTSNGMDVSLLRASMLMEYPVRNYADMLMYYTKRILTNESDALRALEGITRRFAIRMGYRITQGMPIGCFDLFVLFYGTNLYRRPGFPSYSWAGWVGGININCWHSNLNDWLRDQTWIIWYKRSPSGVVSLVWDPAANDSFPVDDMTAQGYRGRTRFQSPVDWISTSRVMPSEDLPGMANRDTPVPPYPLLQFWTLVVFLRLEVVDVFQPQGKLYGIDWVTGGSRDDCGTMQLDGLVAGTEFFFASDEPFEVLVLSKIGSGAEGSYNVLLIEWNQGIAERRGVGDIPQQAILHSFAPGPIWKEIVLG